MRSAYSVSNLSLGSTEFLSPRRRGKSGYIQVLDESMCVVREDLNEWLQRYLFSSANAPPIPAQFLLDRLTSGLWLSRLAYKLHFSVFESGSKKANKRTTVDKAVFLRDVVSSKELRNLSPHSLPQFPPNLIDCIKLPLNNNDICSFESTENLSQSNSSSRSNLCSTNQAPSSNINRLVNHWVARDNVSLFIKWCRDLGVPQTILFETSGLTDKKEERNVILTLMELARIAARFGLTDLPFFVKMEREIDELEAIRTSDPDQDYQHLDELVSQNANVVNSDDHLLDELPHIYNSNSANVIHEHSQNEADSDFEFEINDDLKSVSAGSVADIKLSLDQKSHCVNENSSVTSTGKSLPITMSPDDHSSCDDQDSSVTDSGCLIQTQISIKQHLNIKLINDGQSLDSSLMSDEPTHTSEDDECPQNVSNNFFINKKTVHKIDNFPPVDTVVVDVIDINSGITSPNGLNNETTITETLQLLNDKTCETDKLVTDKDSQLCDNSISFIENGNCIKPDSLIKSLAHDELTTTTTTTKTNSSSMTTAAAATEPPPIPITPVLDEKQTYPIRSHLQAPISINVENNKPSVSGEIDDEIDKAIKNKEDAPEPDRSTNLDEFPNKGSLKVTNTTPIRRVSDVYIDNMVRKKVAECTCCSRLHMQRLDEGRYKFGRKIFYVRRFRNHVMIRVGGGWLTIDEFFRNHDPCKRRQPVSSYEKAGSDLKQNALGESSQSNSLLSLPLASNMSLQRIDDGNEFLRGNARNVSKSRLTTQSFSNKDSSSKWSNPRCKEQDQITLKPVVSKVDSNTLNSLRNSRDISKSVSRLPKANCRM